MENQTQQNTENIYDVDINSFATKVMEQSMTTPVIVDLGAVVPAV